MCSMARTGSSMPTIRPTSRAHSPPALTTCSAWIASPLSIRTSHVPSGRCESRDHRRVLVDLRARQLGALDVGAGDAGRVDVALDRVVQRPDEVLRVHQREEVVRLRWPRSSSRSIPR